MSGSEPLVGGRDTQKADYLWPHPLAITSLGLGLHRY